MAVNIKYPKPDRFHRDPRSYQSWITGIELYFDSCRITVDEDRIRFTLGYLHRAAEDWKQDFIHQKAATGNLGTYTDFRAALDQSFRLIQHAEESHRKLL